MTLFSLKKAKAHILLILIGLLAGIIGVIVLAQVVDFEPIAQFKP